MADIERKLGGILTGRRETRAERAALFKEADSEREVAVRALAESDTLENRILHNLAYEKELDLLNKPLAVSGVRLLGIVPIPGGSIFFPTTYLSPDRFRYSLAN